MLPLRPHRLATPLRTHSDHGTPPISPWDSPAPPGLPAKRHQGICRRPLRGLPHMGTTCFPSRWTRSFVPGQASLMAGNLQQTGPGGGFASAPYEAPWLVEDPPPFPRVGLVIRGSSPSSTSTPGSPVPCRPLGIANSRRHGSAPGTPRRPRDSPPDGPKESVRRPSRGTSCFPFASGFAGLLEGHSCGPSCRLCTTARLWLSVLWDQGRNDRQA